MSVRVEIENTYKEFCLQVRFSSDAKRIGILGASGSGKSMMLKTIAGIEKPKKGRIEIDGRILFDSDKHLNVRTQKRNVGYMFQNYALFPTMTVRQNILAGIKDRTASAQEIIEKCGLKGLENRLPSELSGGQQQRVALARILAYDPDVILLDEPFSALDMYLKDRMQRELLKRLKEFGKTVILVSHDRDEIYRFSEEVVIIEEGKIVAQGETKQLFSRPGSRTAARLTGCKNLSRARRLGDHTFLAEDWGVSLHTKQVLPEEFRHVGYRAHEFVPVWGTPTENCIPFVLESFVQLPFEQNYYIRPQKEAWQPEDILTWFVQRERWKEIQGKGMPDYLQFQEKDILFLK
ncbi:MAG: ATP-binding cassette domain-containing protein [Eubacterium sp.]|nr:ATP-binding cassette domain-containing protein [Eubacterium sp.]